MEEQILKMLKPSMFSKDKKEMAKEITAHVFEFIEWLRMYCIPSKPKPGWRCYYVDEKTYREFDYSKGYRYLASTKEAYQYWSDNIKK